MPYAFSSLPYPIDLFERYGRKDEVKDECYLFARSPAVEVSVMNQPLVIERW